MEKDTFWYLSEQEKAKISGKFLPDTVLVEAVRKVILSGVYFDGVLGAGIPADPLRNFILGTMTKPQIALAPMQEKGLIIQTIINSISLVESGFKEFEKLKKVDELPTTSKPTGR